jgi:hypothetical protein
MATPLLFLKREKLRIITSFALFVMLLPAGLMAQTTLPAAPVPAQAVIDDPGLLTDLNSKDYTPAAPTWADTPNLDALPPSSEKHADRAFLNVAARSGSGRNAVRDKIALIVLSLAVHATVTWDAQSTNHFFHHYPEGFRPSELDPLMRPFAGKELMYPMANVLLAAPFDLLLFETRHSHKPVRILGYAAASFWAGVEVHQSIVNMRNEHISSR